MAFLEVTEKAEEDVADMRVRVASPTAGVPP